MIDLTTYMRARGYAPATIRLYTDASDRVPWRDTDALISALADLANRPAWQRITYYAAALAQEAAQIPDRIVDRFDGRPPRRPSALPRAHDRDTMRALLLVPDRERDRLLLTVAYACALRISELCNLRLYDATTYNNQLLIRETKTGSNQRVPLTNGLQARIRRYGFRKPNSTSPNTYLFPRTHDPLLPISPRGVRHIWADVQTRYNVEPLRFHSIRHAAAIHALQAGYNIEQVRRLLRHRSLASTQIYLQCLTLDPVKLID